MRTALLAALLLLVLASDAFAQAPAPPTTTAIQVPRGPRKLSGPRVGLTLLSDRTVDLINDRLGRETCQTVPPYDCTRDDVIGSMPVISQFGWQWETRLFQLESGTTGLAEIVGLVGGAEYGILLPSATMLIGLRVPGGAEFGVGPNISATSIGYALTVGHSLDLGELAFPVNAALVLSPDGPRASLLVGFVIANRSY